MNAIKNRINSITNDCQVVCKPQREVPFWKNIVQIEFNAWHYADSNLWASLVEHVFRNLRLSDEEDEQKVRERTEFVLKKLDDALVNQAAAEKSVETA